MNPAPIYLTHEDHARLRLLLAAALQNNNSSGALEKLREELDRAVVVDRESIPAGVVTLESRVEFEDLGDHEVEEYTITSPDHANIELKRMSVMAPIGTALIGFREGDEVSWKTPGGVRQLKIRRVVQPQTASV